MSTPELRRKNHEEILDLFRAWDRCKKCPLGELREDRANATDARRGRMVFGDGNSSADIVVIGGSPSEEDDAESMPFVGEWGGIINDYLVRAQLDRRNMFFMNTVACYPHSIVTDKGRERVDGREPSANERITCRPLWQEILYLIDPLLVVVLGKTAAIEVTGNRSISMATANNCVHNCVVPGRTTPVSYPVVVAHHPSFLLKSGDVYHGGPWHMAEIAWKRTSYYLDILKNRYYGEEIPNRGFGRKDMFRIKEGLPT